MWANSDTRMSLFLLSRSLSLYKAAVAEETGPEVWGGGGGGGGESMMGQRLLWVGGL